MARRAEHDFSAFGTPTGGVGREVFGAHVRLGLDNPADSRGYSVMVDEVQPQKLARNEKSVLASVEGAGKFLGHAS
jgi:hypothetical protein